MSLYSSLVRPILFAFDSESVHDLALDCASIVKTRSFQRKIENFYSEPAPVLATKVAGMDFSSPIGLAAGFDKNCRAVPFLSALGFGHIELGSVTGLPQPGNPRPRIFRLVRDRALINRMGFPSEGAEIIASRLSDLIRTECSLAVLGINLGKSKVTPIDDALEDYQRSFTLLRPYGQYFVLNVSSPNTPELRKLQEKDRLKELFDGIKKLNKDNKPLFVKLAPDLSFEELDEVLAVVDECEIDGLIATNTTFSRDSLIETSKEVGGLSGSPLHVRAVEVVRYIYEQTKGTIPIIGVGGVSSADDVVRMMKAGASLVQIYTAFIYGGPAIVKKIKQDLVQFCVDEGIGSVNDIVGSASK